MNKYFKYSLLFVVLGCVVGLCSCTPTYDSDYVADSIKEICMEEYGITNVEIKIEGKTLGVYIPLDQLFSLDYEKFLSGEAMGDLESLVQFHPDALNKVEDVLFSTSRVILSTDRKIDFYLVNATDTLVTGIQFTIIGNVMDMKRVRFWDIPRSEYRKRLIHDLGINRAVLWKKNVIALFEGMAEGKIDDVIKESCVSNESLTTLSPYFYTQLLESYKKEELDYEILDIRAKSFRDKDVLVYAKVKESYTPKPEFADHDFLFENNFIAEYLFVLTMIGTEYKIVQVIPFYIIDEEGAAKRIEFPDELKIYQNLEEWPDDFDFAEIHLEDFIAQQTAKRLQAEIAIDAYIQDNFILGKQEDVVVCAYDPMLEEESLDEKAMPGSFSFYLSLRLKEKLFINTKDLKENEHLLYLLDKVLYEFAYVLNAYSFNDYSHVELHLPLLSQALVIEQADIKKFYKRQISIEEILNRA